MPIEISPNPKRVRVFITKDGQVLPGGAETHLGGEPGFNLGGAGQAGGLPKADAGTLPPIKK